MTRARRRQQCRQTADAAWLRRREDVIVGHPGDHLLESNEFWRGEPDAPASLRTDPYRWRDVLAPPDVAEQIRDARAELLERRRRWLVEQGVRWRPPKRWSGRRSELILAAVVVCAGWPSGRPCG